MGYFASLARQSGVAPAATPAVQRGLEVHVTRPAQPAPPNPPAPLPPAPSSPRNLRPSADQPTSETPETVHEQDTEYAAPPVVAELPHITDCSPQSVVGERLEAEAPPPPAVRIESTDAAAAAERRLPTLTDVQEWISQPVVDAVVHQPPVRYTPLRPTASPDDADDFTLEIGTIQIVIDQQPMPTQPVAPQRLSAPTTPGWRDPSRYYLR